MNKYNRHNQHLHCHQIICHLHYLKSSLTQVFVPLIPSVDSRFQVVAIPKQVHHHSFLLDQSPDKICFFFILLSNISQGGVPGLQSFGKFLVINSEVQTFLRRPSGQLCPQNYEFDTFPSSPKSIRSSEGGEKSTSAASWIASHHFLALCSDPALNK